MTYHADTLRSERHEHPFPSGSYFTAPECYESGIMLGTRDAKRIVFIIYEFLYTHFLQKELICLVESQ